jgi:signal transduction histidine kinase
LRFEQPSDIGRLYRRPLWLSLLLGGALFSAEMAVAFAHRSWFHFPPPVHALVDSAVLLITFSPVMYFLWYRPLAKNIAQLQKAESEVRQLSRKLLSAAEEERRRLSLELHDDCGQALTALHFEVEALGLEGAVEPERVEKLQKLCEALGDKIRNFCFSLRPDILDELGLAPALDDYVKEFGRSLTQIRFDFRAVGSGDRLPPEVEIVLFRVFQEALSNIARHSKADRAEVFLTRSQERVSLEIRDNGVGFEPGPDGTGPRGKDRLGMLGMQERIASIGGKIKINSRPGEGTSLRVEVSTYMENR